MNAMSQDSFQQMCDQVSAVVDAVQFERMRWARDIGPRLAEMVTMTLASIEGRIDLEFSEEQSTTEIKRYILKVHGVRVIGLTMWIEDGQAHMQPIEIDRSRYLLSAKGTLSVELEGLNAEWIALALRAAFGLIEARAEPKAVAPPPPAAPAKQAAVARTQTLRAG